MKKRIIRLLRALLLLYVAALLALFIFQRELIYHAAPSMQTPMQGGAGDAHSGFFESGSQQIHYWYQPPQPNQPSIVYFHGNAGTLARRVGYLNAFSKAGFGFFIMSYRGFNQSTGTPSEQAIYADAAAFIELLTARHSIAPERMILFGESLGTGVAVQMALTFNAAALVLQSPYTSVAARAQELYPWVPVSWLLHDKFDSKAKIAKVKPPLLIIHGQRDEVIPPAHGQALFAAANEPKSLLLLPHFHHSDFPASLILNSVQSFYQKHAPVKPE